MKERNLERLGHCLALITCSALSLGAAPADAATDTGTSTTEIGYAESLYADFAASTQGEMVVQVHVVRTGQLSELAGQKVVDLVGMPLYMVSTIVEESGITSARFDHVDRRSSALNDLQVDLSQFEAGGLPMAEGTYRELEVTVSIGGNQATHTAAELCWPAQAQCLVFDPTIDFSRARRVPSVVSPEQSGIETADPLTLMAAGACSATNKSTVEIKAIGETEYYWAYYDQGRAWTDPRETMRAPVDVAALQYHFVTCKSPSSGKWYVLSVDDNNPPHLYDLTIQETPNGQLNPRPRTGDYGWGVFPKSVKNGLVEVVTRRCVTKPQTISELGVAHAVLGLPWQLKKALPGYLMYILDQVLPDPPDNNTYYCGDMGNQYIPYKISSEGAVTLGEGNWFGIAHWDGTQICGSIQSCWIAYEDTVTISRR